LLDWRIADWDSDRASEGSNPQFRNPAIRSAIYNQQSTMLIALTRSVPPSIARCELTHLEREPIDPERAAAQHAQYEDALRRMGCLVERLPDLPDHPDSVFVEDTAIVLDEVAVVTRPGAESRRGEPRSTAAALRAYRPVVEIDAPATIDGGDVLVAGRRVFVGLSGRTNEHGVRQLSAAVAPFGYEVTTVAIDGCLHLKSAATAIGPAAVLCNPRWVDPRVFDGLEVMTIAPAEPFAANVVTIGAMVLCAAAHPVTAAALARRGLAVYSVDVSELARAEGAVTCCSLLVRQRNAGHMTAGGGGA
jgi:dimethylargininase